MDTEICILSICFINNFYTFLFLALTSMGENEDIEENYSDSDGEVMNTASDLMCSTPPVASPMTLSSSSFLSTSTQRMRTPMRGHGRPVRGKNQSRGRGREFCRGRGSGCCGGRGRGSCGGRGRGSCGGSGRGRCGGRGRGRCEGSGRGRRGRGRSGRKGRGRCGGRGHGSGRVQSSRGDGTSGAPTSVSGSIVPLTVTCNGFTITPVTDDWSVAEPTSHQFTYTKTPGPTSAAICSGNQTAGDLFCRFFTEEVWDIIVSETNGHAETFVSTTPTNRPWVSVSVPEMKAFIGLLILMAICKLPRLEMYWSDRNMLSTPHIASVMCKTRFEQIFRFLHLCDTSQQVPAGQPGHDKLFKVRHFLDMFSSSFDQEYNLHQECSVDEAMIPFKGRVGFKQYMKDKPTKWGIKVFVLADATNGYVKAFQVYTGRTVEGSSDVGLCTKVVLDLLSEHRNSGLTVYMDSYYSSPQLYAALYDQNINAVGTVRSSRRGFPAAELFTKASVSNRGEYKYVANGPLLACSWADKRTIYFLSTFHPGNLPPGNSPPTVKRRLADGSQQEVVCPPLLPDYQAYMRGVDRGDQYISYYNVGRR